MKVSSYLNYLSEDKNIYYIYHYTPKKNLEFIKRNGLMSLFALYHKYPKLYEKNISNYRERLQKFYRKNDVGFDDVTKFFKSKGLSIKSIFFSFWEIIPGLNKERDSFVRDSIKISIDIKKLDSSWDYTLVYGSKTTKIDKNIVLKYSKMDSTNFQMKKGGPFLFSKIPHLSITTNDGIIPKTLIMR